MGSPPGVLRSRPTNTARGTPWVWRTCGTNRFRQASRREVSRPMGPSGPLTSRAPSVFEDGGKDYERTRRSHKKYGRRRLPIFLTSS